MSALFVDHFDCEAMANLARGRAAEHGVVIIGGGQAGGRAAESLRRDGFGGRLTLIGDEHVLPYERPSLSKEMLLDLEAEKITWLHEMSYYDAHSIEVHLGNPAVAIDRDRSRVVLRDGLSLSYGVLVLATGARVRELTVPGAAGRCFYLRSIDDSRTLRKVMDAQHRIVVIGAGFIGLEVAAAARSHGASVSVIETSTSPLSRLAPPLLQDYVRGLHAAHGVAFHFGATVESIDDFADHRRVWLGGGEALEADAIVVGIGAVPNVELAVEAGLPCNRGVLVNSAGATADPLIFAIGDVAERAMPLTGRPILLESWQNAQDQAIALSAVLAKEESPKAELARPWFWSDQYDRNIQIYGLMEPDLEWIERGSRDGGPWLLSGVREGRVEYAAGVNAGRDLRALRELMKLGAAVNIEALADPNCNLLGVLNAARVAS